MIGKDKSMGRATISILDWIATGSFEGNVPLKENDGKEVGQIKLLAQFKRVDQNANSELTEGRSNPKEGTANNYTDEQIIEAFRAFDLDKNNFVGAAEIRHVLVNIGERVTDEEVSSRRHTSHAIEGVLTCNIS